MTPVPFRTPITAELVRGAVELEPTDLGLRPHRLPAWARAQSMGDGQLAMAEAQPSGVRLVFRTAASVVELAAARTRVAYVGAPPRPDGVLDLRIGGRLVGHGTLDGGHTLHVDLRGGGTRLEPGAPGRVRFELPGGSERSERDVELWLPWNETVELVALHSDAPLTPTPRDPRRRVWLHHGSSISQGSNAASPSQTWPAVAALAAGVEVVNLGFGGGAMLDPFTARTLRDLPADVVSLELGVNVVNTDLMRRRAFGPAVHGFLDTIREGHPQVPLVVVTPFWCGEQEDTPGPLQPELVDGRVVFRATGDPADTAAGRLTLRVVREVLADVVTARRGSDPHLHLLDGPALYGAADASRHPLPDGLHPDAATHRLIGERFAATALDPRSPGAPGSVGHITGGPAAGRLRTTR